MITIVDLNLIPCVEPLISSVLFDAITRELEGDKKVLLSLNRRGAMSTLVCRDCGWAARCPHCDLMMRVHHTPRLHLLCHFCEGQSSLPDRCPACQSFHIVQSGARVQTAEQSLRRLFPERKILLIEKGVEGLSQSSLRENDIFIGTQKITSLPIENLGLAAFLLVESDLSVPAYNVEEEVYSQVRYFFSRADTVLLQTRSPRIRLIEDIEHKNFRDFYRRTLLERKQFGLPPMMEMVAIHIAESSESALKMRVATLASAMMQRASSDPSIDLTYDHLLVERRGGEYYQKILIKGTDIMRFLEPFRDTLVRGRGIEVEWL